LLRSADWVVSALVGTAYAQGAGAGLRDRLVEQLGLNESQQAKLDAILTEYRPKLMALREMPEDQRALERDKVIVPMRAAINNILNKDQKAKYAVLVAQQQARTGGQTLLVELANRQQSRGRVYLLGADGKPRAINVRLGISDGTFTELLVGPGANEVTEGSQVIVGLAQAGGGGTSGGGASGGSQRPSGPRLPF
jgi:HlyD family secretion protein